MFVVDTNVLVYAANVRADEHLRCRALVEKWRLQRGAWYLTWGICYEFLRVVTHPRVLESPWTADVALGFLDALRAAPGLAFLTPTDRHADVLSELAGDVPLLQGNLWHDAETVCLMREHGIRRICTRDTNFHRFPRIESVDPMVAEP